MTTATHADLLEVRNVTRHYRLPREHLWQPAPIVEALKGVSLRVHARQSLGIVGESGSGKSTLAKLIMALEVPTSGEVLFSGCNLHTMGPAELRAARRDFQMVFQDPYGSLDPRMTIERVVGEPLLALGGRSSRVERRLKCAQTLDAVGLSGSDLDKYPHEFSGGQRQRIAIARAIVTRPKLIVADEPVSALDVSVQAQVLNLLQDLQRDLGLTLILISHDLAVVRHVCEQVAVMQHGRIVEYAQVDALFDSPQHPYTQQLLAAAR